jgi:hypothetical protein
MLSHRLETVLAFVHASGLQRMLAAQFVGLLLPALYRTQRDVRPGQVLGDFVGKKHAAGGQQRFVRFDSLARVFRARW